MLGADKNTCAFFVFGEILLASTQRETAVLQLCNVLYLGESSKQTWAGVHVQQARVQEREKVNLFTNNLSTGFVVHCIVDTCVLGGGYVRMTIIRHGCCFF